MALESEAIEHDTPDKNVVEHSLALDGRGKRLQKTLQNNLRA